MGLSFRSGAIAATALGLTLLATGCNSKVAQCNKLIKVANKATTELKAMAKDGGSTPADKMAQMKKLADGLAQYSNDVKAVSLDDEQLKGFQTRLADLYQTSSEASRGILAAAEKKDVKAARESLKKLSGGRKTESEIVQGINGYCQAK